MSKVIAHATMSLDGFIADPHDAVGPLFDWYDNGEVAVSYGDTERMFHTTEASAGVIRAATDEVGAGVIGRRLFDLTNGWNGRPSTGDAVVVLTHEAPTDWEYADTAPFEFVTTGVTDAIERARELAGGRDVAVTAGDVAGQALAEGLVEVVDVALVPVLFGSGVRFVGGLSEQVMLENPRVIEGDRVLHLRYDVRR